MNDFYGATTLTRAREAEVAATEQNGKSEPVSHLDRAKELVAYWQERLYLRDWEIVVKVKKGRDLHPERQAECVWELRNKHALVALLDPDHVDTREFFHYDMEESVIHELLHLHMGTFAEPADGTVEDVMMEQVIHLLSKAFLAERRAAR